MRRRNFIINSSVLSAGIALARPLKAMSGGGRQGLYELFRDPDMNYRPFVRWWWNGDKIEKTELARELQLLKDAGIGGVEINPIRFPGRTPDMGKPSVPWLSKEWISLLDFTLTEAKKLNITNDLLVGSGWPFGDPSLEGEERSQLMTIGAVKLKGSSSFNISVFEMLKFAEPQLASPYQGLYPELVSVQLVPSPMNSLDEAIAITSFVKDGMIKCEVPAGNFVLYALVKMTGFMQVIYGAPGAGGPVLNHYNGLAVKKYLNRMSDTIQAQIGPLSGRVRAFFCDSLELEGANWCSDMAAEFKSRRGYDLMRWLPFILFKTWYMGDTMDAGYGATFTTEFLEQVKKVRYDFELTKTELFKERFIDTFTSWCKANGVKSRMQAYGRGYLPLEGSMAPDIPEAETWLKNGLGQVMSDTDYTAGRAYTVVNKFVSSAAHLTGKREISCEELTNTEMVFFESLEIMKTGADQSTLSGITHPIFHGFNYSPKDAPFPGWVRYGCYINEHNPWWPYFKLFTAYKARLSAILQQGDMFADIAVLPATADLWRDYGSQNDPFPQTVEPSYQPMIWEAIHRNGSGCDYVSEAIIQNASIISDSLHYGKRKYSTIFLVKAEHIAEATKIKLQEFAAAGGKVYCIEMPPLNTSFTVIPAPTGDITQWYKDIQKVHQIAPYIVIDQPNKFVSQLRYQAGETEILFFANSDNNQSYQLKMKPTKSISHNRQAWLWDAETGEREPLPKAEKITLNLGPACSKLLVFDKNFSKPKPAVAALKVNPPMELNKWELEGTHSNGQVIKAAIAGLKDLKELEGWADFCGTVHYTAKIHLSQNYSYIDLGKVAGISTVSINGREVSTRWCGRRVDNVTLSAGDNTIEVSVVTTMGNYMKSLKTNPIAQYWTNSEEKNQPLQSIGLLGPVQIS